MLTAHWISDKQQFATLAAEWDVLLPEDARPFDLHCWYSNWWEAFGDPYELAVCTLRSGNELVAVAPLARDGAELRALANAHSSVFRPLARDSEALQSLMEEVMSQDASRLEMTALPTDDPCASLLESGLDDAPMRFVLEPGAVSPIVDTNGDFDEWRKGSKPRWGAPLERFRRKMGRDHEAELSIVEPPDDLEAELEDGFRVEASGWKGEAGTAIISDPSTLAFYSGLARAFNERGELRLSRIALDGETAAVDLCLLHRSRLYLLKTGFDERFRRLAPGLVMRLSIIERCFELDLDAHELLGDDSEWKRKFATSDRSHLNVQAFAGGPEGYARYVYRKKLRPVLRRGYRRLRPRRH